MTDLRRIRQVLKLQLLKIAAIRSLAWLRARNARALRGLLTLCAVVVLAQGIELAHSHDDLQSHLDCHICVKLGSKAKAVAAGITDFGTDTRRVLFVSNDRDLPFVAVPPAKSRAPPRYS